MLSEKPWAPEAVLRLLALLGLSLAVGAVLIGLFSGGSRSAPGESPRAVNLILGTASFHGAALALVHWFLRQNSLRWREAFGFREPGLCRALLLGLLGAFAALPVAWVLSQASAAAMSAADDFVPRLREWLLARELPGFLRHWAEHSLVGIDLEPVVQPTVRALQGGAPVWLTVYVGLAAVLVAPFVEEVLFRGILYPTLKDRGYRRTALWGVSLLFAAIHGNLMTFVPLTFLALMLTLLYEQTGNLLAPILTHALFNALNFVWLVRSV
jgi:membrane protease YdiL (CAAX protease family)